jgi:hypothetical protein
MKNVMIAMPCYSAKVHFPTMRAILLDAINIIGRGDKFCIAEDIGNSDIAGSRGALFGVFARSECDTLVFIDDDVFWEPGALIQLIDYPVDVVGGIYPKKQDPLAWPFKIEEKTEYPVDPETGLLEVLGLPGGFMKISKNCAQKMIKAYPRQTLRSTSEHTQFWPLFDPYEMPDGNRLSEDFSFCQRWIDIGGKVWTNLEFELGHIGYKTYKGSCGKHLRQAENNVK